jgi:hypothetical protein
MKRNEAVLTVFLQKRNETRRKIIEKTKKENTHDTENTPAVRY